MRSILETCVPREEVMKGELDDALFAADFGHVIEGRARSVYQDPTTFFRNTYPAAQLVRLTQAVFRRLANPSEPGALLRLSTGFGGGKTHALIAMWHLAQHIGDPAMGRELVPAEMRPTSVRVVGVDGDKLGYPIARDHPDARTRSLWGEMAYQLGGKSLLADFQECDDAEAAPSADLLRKMLDCGQPVLILLDELVKYMVKVPERAKKNIRAFISSLTSEIVGRPQAVLIITDPAAQAAYAEEAQELGSVADLDQAKRLGDELNRQATDFDPIGEDAARVISRRLFEHMDPSAADEAAREYVAAYHRILTSNPDALPKEAATEKYAARIRECYPFHPRLVETAQDRLGALPAFNKSRGTLRLFARILRQLWETKTDTALITAGDVDVTAERIQADLLYRLNRDQFRSPISADCDRHASELDQQHGGDFHRRVARALLIESLPMTEKASMDRREIALATLRPSDIGTEPAEALDRLVAVGWYTYHDDHQTRYQFRVEPNLNKVIYERAQTIPVADARENVFTRVQQHYAGSTFKLLPFPSSPKAVPDTADLKLVLAESVYLAQRICNFVDDSDPEAPEHRRFRNAIVALAPDDRLLDHAVERSRWLKAAEEVNTEARRSDNPNKPLIDQLDKRIVDFQRDARISACRAFTRVVFHSRESLTLDEGYLVPQDSAVTSVKGQESLKRFLDDKGLIFKPEQTVDLDLLCSDLLKGATPSPDHDGAYTASSLHERALASPKLRLMRGADPVRNAVLKAVQEGRLVVRMPNGDCYDKDGMVSGPEGARSRSPRPLRSLNLNNDVLIAPADAPCVAAWFAVKEASPGDPTPPPPPPPPSTARDWATAAELARTRPLRKLTLTTSRPEAGRRLMQLAQPFGAGLLKLTVMTSGDLKDGGTVSLSMEDVKPTSAARPLETSATLAKSVKEDTVSYRAELTLEFPEEGADQAQARLEQAGKKAGEDFELTAEFGEEE